MCKACILRLFVITMNSEREMITTYGDGLIKDFNLHSITYYHLCQGCINNLIVCFAETFKVDINNTVNLLKGEIGSQIRDRDIIVSFTS